MTLPHEVWDSVESTVWGACPAANVMDSHDVFLNEAKHIFEHCNGSLEDFIEALRNADVAYPHRGYLSPRYFAQEYLFNLEYCNCELGLLWEPASGPPLTTQQVVERAVRAGFYRSVQELKRDVAQALRSL